MQPVLLHFCYSCLWVVLGGWYDSTALSGESGSVGIK